MTETYWLMAKYMPDLRRREPRNMGVILISEGSALSKFKGEREDGRIDGRTVQLGSDLATYRAWIDYWRHEFRVARPLDDVGALLDAQSDQQMILEFGGRVVAEKIPTTPEVLLDDLFGMVVEEPGEEARDETLPDMSRELLASAGVLEHVIAGFKFESRVNDRTDLVRFDYRYDNGRPHLLQNVSLALADERSWHNVHAAAWSFDRANHEGFRSLVALVKGRDPDEDYEYQFRLIESYANVIDVTMPSSVETLRQVLTLEQTPPERPDS